MYVLSRVTQHVLVSSLQHHAEYFIGLARFFRNQPGPWLKRVSRIVLSLKLETYLWVASQVSDYCNGHIWVLQHHMNSVLFSGCKTMDKVGSPQDILGPRRRLPCRRRRLRRYVCIGSFSFWPTLRRLCVDKSWNSFILLWLVAAVMFVVCGSSCHNRKQKEGMAAWPTQLRLA